MMNLKSDTSDLRARFPYQFEGKHLSIDVAPGWATVFSKLCEDVDQLLGQNKRDFCWTQVKEKLGSARFRFMFEQQSPDLREGQSKTPNSVISRETDRRTEHDSDIDELAAVLRKLVSVAETQTKENCALCGKSGELDRSTPNLLVLCQEHARERSG